MKRIEVFMKLMLCVIIGLVFIPACTNQGKDFAYNEGNVTSHIISIETARNYTSSFRDRRSKLQESLGGNAFQLSEFQLPNAVQFNRDVLAMLLNQKDTIGNVAQGVRMYFAVNDKREVTLVLVPYDSKNNDIIRKLVREDAVSIPGINSASAFFGGEQAVDNALRCPSLCDNGVSGLSN